MYVSDMNKFTEMLRASFSSTISPGSVVAVDELLIGFSSRKDNQIISIKRKPHNRGYLIYMMCAKTMRTKLPLVCDFSLVLKDNEQKLHYQITSFADRILSIRPILRYRFHIITDSAFGSRDLALTLRNKGVYLTSSMKKVQIKYYGIPFHPI